MTDNIGQGILYQVENTPPQEYKNLNIESLQEMLDSIKPDLNTKLTIHCVGIQDYEYWKEKLKQNETERPY